MIDFYTAKSPNAYKVSICLEELAIPYRLIPLRFDRDEHRASDFLHLSPNGKIPVIVDTDSGQAIFESGAVLLYLADKAQRLIPASGIGRWEVIKWLFFHSATIGPTLAQRANFGILATEKLPSVVERFTKETERLYSVLDAQLEGREYLCDDYSIADIANFGWLYVAKVVGFSFDRLKYLSAWYTRVESRPGTVRGTTVPAPADGL